MRIHEEESENLSSKKKIRLHIFEYISKFSNHRIRTLKDDNTCSECKKLKSDD